MKIVYLGSGEFGIESLKALFNSRHDLEFIVTALPQPAGRGRKPKQTPVASWADERSMPFIQTNDANAKEVMEEIKSHKPDLILVIAFGQKIGNDLIKLPPKGAINVHASLLPKYRGAAPINWAIINGESETGVSIISLTEKMDAGPVCAQIKTSIEPDETAGQLHDRLAKLSAQLLLETLERIENNSAVFVPQDCTKVTKAPKLKKSDGYIDFNESAEILCNKIRGFWPWPGATALYHSVKRGKSLSVTLAEARLLDSSNPSNLLPGTLDKNLNIICGENALQIIKIKPAGGSVMNFRDFVNGQRTAPGDLFTKLEE